jgi:hypothetical protein
MHLLTVRGSGYLFDPPATFEDGFSNVNEPPTQR